MMERRNFRAMFSITLPLTPRCDYRLLEIASPYFPFFPIKSQCQFLRILGHDNNRGQQIVCRRQTIAHPPCHTMKSSSSAYPGVLVAMPREHPDMHLKNFSLYDTGMGYSLTPAYDLLSTVIVMPEDTEELALTLNGKKRKIWRSDFEKSIIASGGQWQGNREHRLEIPAFHH